MARKQKATTIPRVVVAVRIAEVAALRLRAVAARDGKRLSTVIRDVLERAARRAA